MTLRAKLSLHDGTLAAHSHGMCPSTARPCQRTLISPRHSRWCPLVRVRLQRTRVGRRQASHGTVRSGPAQRLRQVEGADRGRAAGTGWHTRWRMRSREPWCRSMMPRHRTKRSYRVDFSLFQSLAPAHQPQADLAGTIDAPRKGLTAMHFHDQVFRSSSFMRLRVLADLMSRGLLSRTPEWADKHTARDATGVAAGADPADRLASSVV